jgi:hypothetical protein
MARYVELITSKKMKLSKYSLGVYRKGMYLYGHEFYDIARKTRRSPVKSYLLGHALELFLKSFLMRKGVGIKNLKTLSHNLNTLLKESLDYGVEDYFNVSKQLKTDIASFSRVYTNKAYEYFPFWTWVFRQKFPNTARLFRFAKQLDKKLPAIIK